MCLAAPGRAKPPAGRRRRGSREFTGWGSGARRSRRHRLYNIAPGYRLDALMEVIRHLCSDAAPAGAVSLLSRRRQRANGSVGRHRDVRGMTAITRRDRALGFLPAPSSRLRRPSGRHFVAVEQLARSLTATPQSPLRQRAPILSPASQEAGKSIFRAPVEHLAYTWPTPGRGCHTHRDESSPSL